MTTSAPAEPAASAPAADVLEVALELARVPAHPDDHVGDHATATSPMTVSSVSCCFCGRSSETA